MKRKILEPILVALLLATLVIVSKTEMASASGTIYIRENGDVDPEEAPISRDGNTYTLTNNIFETIVIQRDNIVVDGNGYILQGSAIGAGFNLTNRNNVTLKNTYITQFEYGIYLSKSNSNTIDRNTLDNNAQHGIFISNSSDNIVSRNEAISNIDDGIYLYLANNTQISGNNASGNGANGISIGYRSFNNRINHNSVHTNSYDGISLDWEPSTGNRVIGNNITNSGRAGIYIVFSSVSDNEFYHNNLENELQVSSGSINAVNIWDNGYPSGGNYWSDYEGQDLNGDGIGDTPYVIDVNNQDDYPFMNPWTPEAYDIAITNVAPSKIYVGQNYNVNITVTVTNQGSYTQTFNITAYANQTKIETQTLTLTSQSSETLTFTWSTAGVTKGFYTLNATADQMPGEIDTLDNTHQNGTIKITVAGDVNGDTTVNVHDLYLIGKTYGSIPPTNTNCDINEDNTVNQSDLEIAVGNYSQKT